MKINIWIALILMAAVTYIIRVLPLTLIRKQIKNKTIRSFLYYVPYVTLSVMTFPAIIEATKYIWAGIAAFAVALILSWRGQKLFTVSIAACTTVFVIEIIMNIVK